MYRWFWDFESHDFDIRDLKYSRLNLYCEGRESCYKEDFYSILQVWLEV